MAPCGWCLPRVCAGTRRSKYLKENLEAAAIQLTPEEVQELNTIFSHDKVWRRRARHCGRLGSLRWGGAVGATLGPCSSLS